MRYQSVWLLWVQQVIRDKLQAVFHKGQNSDLLALVNDASNEIPFVTLKYVNDLALEETRSRSKISVMQQHLYPFEDWAEVNNMKLKPKKCTSMTVSFMHNSTNNLRLLYRMSLFAMCKYLRFSKCMSMVFLI